MKRYPFFNKSSIPLLLLILFVGILTASCCNCGKSQSNQKISADLRSTIESMQENGDITPVKCLLQLNSQLTNDIRSEIEKLNIRIVNDFGTGMTVEGTAESLMELSSLPFVLRLESDKKIFPNN